MTRPQDVLGRVQCPAAHIGIIWLRDLQARVVADYAGGTITLQQRQCDGGRITRPMSEYDSHPGDLRDWVRHVRQEASGVRPRRRLGGG